MQTAIQHTEETEHAVLDLFWGLKALCLAPNLPSPSRSVSKSLSPSGFIRAIGLLALFQSLITKHCIESRIMDWLGLEKTFKDHLLQPPGWARMSFTRAGCSSPIQLNGWYRDSFKGRDDLCSSYITTPSSCFQCCVRCWVCSLNRTERPLASVPSSSSPFPPSTKIYLQTLSKVSQLGTRACLEPYPKRTGCAHKNIYSSQGKLHMGRSWIQLCVYPVKSRCLKQDQIPAQVKSVLRMKTIFWWIWEWQVLSGWGQGGMGKGYRGFVSYLSLLLSLSQSPRKTAGDG